jgi:hypothetical protein
MANYINSLVPISSVYDVDVIEGLDINSKEFKDFLVRLRQDINGIAISVNGRDGGSFGLGEYNTGTQFFPDAADPTTYRSVVRTVIDFGALPNVGVKLVNHNINTPTGTTVNYVFTRVYGVASNPTILRYLPIPYTEPGGFIASLFVTATQVGIETSFNALLYNGIIVLEYIVN